MAVHDERNHISIMTPYNVRRSHRVKSSLLQRRSLTISIRVGVFTASHEKKSDVSEINFKPSQLIWISPRNHSSIKTWRY